jgi:hypothetical protein
MPEEIETQPTTTTKEINWKVPFSTRVKEDCREFFKQKIKDLGTPVAVLDHCIRFTMNGISLAPDKIKEVAQAKEIADLKAKLQQAEAKLAAKPAPAPAPAPVGGIELDQDEKFWLQQLLNKKPKLVTIRKALTHAIHYTFKNDWL